MPKIEIDIRDNIEPTLALECVTMVVNQGKISQGEKGKKYYCWATTFNTTNGEVVVSTKQYRKNDCFVVYKREKGK
jgi:hypothetical protein